MPRPKQPRRFGRLTGGVLDGLRLVEDHGVELGSGQQCSIAPQAVP